MPTFPAKRRKVTKFDENAVVKEEEVMDVEVAEDKKDTGAFKEEIVKKSEYHKDAALKQWRIIVRNLPFKCTKSDLQNAASKFGTFTDIVLPPGKDKRFPKSCAGFGFIQFKERASAEKAKVALNSIKILGRAIAADWAIPKDTYETVSHDEKKKLAEKVKQEKADDDSKMKNAKRKFEDSDDDEEEDDEDEEMDDEDEEEDEEESDEEEEEPKRRERKPDEAVEEQRVVFLRNLSFDTTEDAVKAEAEKYGEVKLAIICKFHDSGHSKGSAFVHFAKKEEAEAMVHAGYAGKIVIDNRDINGTLAVNRQKAEQIDKDKNTKSPKDKRNLHLLRAGIIRLGTGAAAGMSETDAAMRDRLATVARKKLENLTMFVSPVRLVVHNLPLSFTDTELKNACYKAAGNPDATITEYRIWRDTGKLDAKGHPMSRGFGFVAFSEHTDALACLQKLNNCPKTFSDKKRPIVEFSVENLKAIRMRERRAVKSQNKNATEGEIEDRIRKQVETTTKDLRAKGLKPLPSHSGAKIRHKHSKSKKELAAKAEAKAAAALKAPKKKKKSGNNPNRNAQLPKQSKSNKRTLTKFLAHA